MKRALLIGINYTNSSDSALQGCVNDVTAVGDKLKSNFGFVCTKLIESVATKERILTELAKLVNTAVSGDTIVVHYSGHGSWIVDKSGDESDNRDEVICPVDFKTNGFITDDTLYSEFVAKLAKGVLLMMFSDSCHSGTILDLKYNWIWNDNGTFTFANKIRSDNLECKCDAILFSGCMDTQLSADAYINFKYSGAFTNALLSTGVLNSNHNVTLLDLLNDINTRLVRNGFKNQTSQLSTTMTDLSAIFPLVPVKKPLATLRTFISRLNIFIKKSAQAKAQVYEDL